MRRKLREIMDTNELITIIEGCRVCRVAMVDNRSPYVLPMNFGYSFQNNEFIFYLHCAKEGRKIQVLTTNPHVCIELDTMKELITGADGCDYSCHFKSFIGFGEAIFVDDADEKQIALDAIMLRQTGKQSFTYNDRVMNQTRVIKVVLDSWSGKGH